MTMPRSLLASLALLLGCAPPPAVPTAPLATVETKPVVPVAGEELLLATLLEAEPAGPDALVVDGTPIRAEDGGLRFGDHEVSFDDERSRRLVGAIGPDGAVTLVHDATPLVELWSASGLVRRHELRPAVGDLEEDVAVARGAYAIRNAGGVEIYGLEGRLHLLADAPRSGRLSLADGGGRLLVAGYAGTALYDAAGKILVELPGGREGYATASALAADGSRFALRQVRGPLVVRGLGGGEGPSYAVSQYDEVERLALRGEALVARLSRAGQDFRVVVYRSKREPEELPGADFRIDPADPSRIGLASGRGWRSCSLSSMTCEAPSRHGGAVVSLATSAGGTVILSAAADGSVLLHRLTAAGVYHHRLPAPFRARAPRLAASAKGVALMGWFDPKARGGLRDEPVPSLLYFALPADPSAALGAPLWSRPLGWREELTAIAAGAGLVWGREEDGEVLAYELAAGEPVLRLPVQIMKATQAWEERGVPTLLAPNGSALLRSDGLMSLPDGELLASEAPSDLENCVMSREGRATLCRADEGFVLTMREAEGLRARSVVTPGERLLRYAVAASGAVAVVTENDDGDEQLWLRAADPADAGEAFRMVSPPSAVTALAFYGDGERLLAGHADGALTIWRVPD
ncbi:MAG: hypothetical protein R3B72_12745 [Polyangiaceae bacterium]